MTRWLLAIAAVLLVIGAGYLVVLNPERVVVHLTPARVLHPPLAAALLVAFAAGLLVAALLAAGRAGQRGLRAWRQRRQARRAAHQAAATARARDLLWTGHFTAVRSTLLEPGEEVPADAARLALIAESYLQEGDAAAARRLLEHGMARVGLEPRLLDLLADAAEAMGDFRGAADALARARLGQPDSPRLARRLRDLHMRMERWDEALTLQGQILLRVQGTAALAAEERLLRGLRYQTTLTEPDARRAARRLVALAREDPAFLAAWVSAGDHFARAGRTFAARRAWERGARQEPAAVLLDRLEQLNATAGRPDRTARLYRRLQRRHPGSHVLSLLLVRHELAEGRLPQAAAVLDALPEPVASSGLALALRGELERVRGDLTAAVESLSRAARRGLRLSSSFETFECTACRRRTEVWEAYCPDCRRWNTMRSAAELAATTPQSPPAL